MTSLVLNRFGLSLVSSRKEGIRMREASAFLRGGGAFVDYWASWNPIFVSNMYMLLYMILKTSKNSNIAVLKMMAPMLDLFPLPVWHMKSTPCFILLFAQHLSCCSCCPLALWFEYIFPFSLFLLRHIEYPRIFIQSTCHLFHVFRLLWRFSLISVFLLIVSCLNLCFSFPLCFLGVFIFEGYNTVWAIWYDGRFLSSCCTWFDQGEGS